MKMHLLYSYKTKGLFIAYCYIVDNVIDLLSQPKNLSHNQENVCST